MRKLYNLTHKLKAYFLFTFSTMIVLASQAQNQDGRQLTAQPYNFSTFYKPNQASTHPYWKEFNGVDFQQHPEFGILPHDAPCENCVEDYSKRTSNERYFIDIQDTFVFYQQTGYGDLNYWNGQYWLSIDHRLKFNEIKGLHANYFANPLFLNPANNSIEIEHNGLLLKFNNWKLYKSVDDQKIFLFEANWSEFTSGDDGVFVKNIFPGIDAEFIVMRGTVKTNFIINSIESIGVFDQLIFEDQFSLKNGQTTRTKAHENSAAKEFIGSFSIYDNEMNELVQYGEGLAYSKADPKNNSTALIYQLSDESVAILVPSDWLLEQLQNSPVVIDPIVTGTNTLAQASILGSMYNASCNFINSCNYNLTVVAPASAVFQNVTWNFNYNAQGACWLMDGATRFSVGSCVSPGQAGFYWFCNAIGGGTCTGNNVSIFNDVSSCLPAPSCSAQNVTFTLQFFRSCWGAAGCNNACIGAASPWSITITGRTLEYSNTVNPITVSSTTICQGQSITASTTGLYGVAPYTYTWSFSPTGIPVIATGQSASINFPNAGSITLYSVITDACGNQVIASRIITVTTGVTPTFAAVGPYCSGATIPALPTTSQNGITGSWAPAINNAATTTYTFTPTAGQCATPTTLTITITPSTTPTFAAVGPFCSGAAIPALPTTSQNGITGTWAPAINNAATTTYTFTPTAGQCAATTTLTITINPNITPTFAAVGPFCSGAAIPALPNTSQNGITGTWVPAINNTATTTYTFTPTAGQCATTTTLTITINPNITPTFAAVGPFCSGANIPALPTNSQNGITGTWAPAINNSATTTYTFTPTPGQCATTTTLTITINPNISPTFAAVGPFCSGANIPALPTNSQNGISGTWSPAINNTATTTYTYTPTPGQCALATTMTITVNPNITPTFAAVGPFCSGANIPALPTNSQNGISGTWAPAINNSATTTYTFTPTVGQCATTTTLTITINPNITPTFAAVGPYCSGANIPAFLTTSQNGITGTWSPAINNTATTTYTFTPTAGQCATTATRTVIINPNVTPTFAAVGPYCSGATIPALPTTSQNGITGTWSPAISNTTTNTYTFTPNAGQCALTTTLTITITPQPPAPTVLCYQTPTWTPSTCSWTVTGTPPNVPVMDLGPDQTICQGQSVTLTAPAGYNSYLWSTGSTAQSINVNQSGTYSVTGTVNIPSQTNLVFNPGFELGNTGFSTSYTVGTGGAWGPVSNGNTYAIVNNPNSAHIHNANCPYQGNMLVANGGNAGNNANVWCQTITIQPNTNYIFSVDAINPHNDAGWGVLPLTLNMVINGVNVGSLTPPLSPNNCNWQTYSSSLWNSGSLTSVTICIQNATSVASLLAIDNLSFSPVLVCTYTDAVNVTVMPNINPTFAAVGPFCSGANIPALPTTSSNGITGTWAPAINNTATTTYTFTPTAGQCALATTMTITVNPNITPTFAAAGPFCSGANIPALPTTSLNGFTGTWAPAINNTATTTYTFTPTAGQCATTNTLSITINPNITPTFAAVGPFCSGANIPALPSTSLNGFTGTWAPAINNTATTTYTFTPTAGQCATTTTLTITINPNITPTFAAVGPFCSGANIPALPTTSLNGYMGTWAPAINNTATTTYTFTPTAGQCATNTTLTITINTNITPTFAAVGPFCSGANIPALPTTSLNGFTGTWAPAIDNTATTTYTFTPTAGQCATTTTLAITIDPNITPTFAAVGPYCSGANIPALPTTSLNGFTGTWSPAINNTATTTYTFTPTAGQCATTTTLTITINPNITPTFAAVGPYCNGANIPALPTTSLNGYTGAWSPAIDNTATTTYTFTPTAGQCATTTNSSIVVNQPNQSITNYSICANNLPYQWNGLSIGSGGQHQVILTNAQGCDSVTLLNLTLIPVLSSTTNVTICANQAPYNWNGQSLSISGTTTVTLTSSFGCDSLATLNLTVNPMPQVSFIANSAASCAPVQVTFTNTSGISGTCQWNLGNGIVSNSCGTVTGIYENYGCYDVTLQITNDFGCTSSLTQNDLICVDPEPIASFNVNPSTLSSFNPQAEFTNTSTGYSSQIWNFGDGSGGSNQNNPAHTYPEEAGQYYVTLVVSNSNGCLDSVTQLIIVENDVIYYIPNTFTPDDDLHNQTFKPIFTAGFDIYQYQMVIFNRWGEIIFESNNAEVGWDGTYGGNLCQDGIYLWQITYKELGKDKRNEIRGHVNLLK